MSSDLIIRDKEQRLVSGPVLIPMFVDAHQDAWSDEEVRKAAFAYLASGKTGNVDVQHDLQVSGCVVVESYLAKQNDPDGYTPGTWVATVIVLSEDVWERVKSGELSGFSPYGGGSIYKAIPCRYEKPVLFKGSTDISVDDKFPPHVHSLEVNFQKAGNTFRPVPCTTGETFGHVHVLQSFAATEQSEGHAHRVDMFRVDGGDV